VSVESREPEPEELVDRLKRAVRRRPEVYDREVRRTVREAESLTLAHQRAVSQYLAEQAGVVSGVPDAASRAVGHAWRTYDDVVIEMILKIDDRLFMARERVDGMTWELNFKPRADRWEEFLNFFARKAVGSMSQDPEQFAYLRRKLFVVTPDDRHDARLCRASNDTGLNQDLWPRCLSGVVRKALPVNLFSVIGDGVGPQELLAQPYRDGRALGRCRCRCHQHPLADVCDPEYHSTYLADYDDRLFVA